MTSHSAGSDGSDMVELLQLQVVEAREHSGGLDDPGNSGLVEQPGAQRSPQRLEVLVVAGRVVAKEAELVVTQAQALLQPVRPSGRLSQAKSLDHEHRAEQVDRIGLAGLVEDERRQRGR